MRTKCVRYGRDAACHLGIPHRHAHTQDALEVHLGEGSRRGSEAQTAQVEAPRRHLLQADPKIRLQALNSIYHRWHHGSRP